jgi:hypothetical protein
MRDIDIKVEINKITSLSPIREKAFFTIMRQSGLRPHIIKQLKIKNVEEILQSDTPIPCKIDIPRQKHPTFIGYEAIHYLKQYLETRKRRESLTLDTLLFTPLNKPNEEINTKNVSRTFKHAIRKLHLPNELHLSSLTKFYVKSTNEYRIHLDYNRPKDDEAYRELYEKYAIPSLEIEPITPIQMHRLENKLNNIEHLLLKELEPEDKRRKWLEEHPEQAKKIEEEAQEREKYLHELDQEFMKGITKHSPDEAEAIITEIERITQQSYKYIAELHVEHLENKVKAFEDRLEKIENIIKRKKSDHKK